MSVCKATFVARLVKQAVVAAEKAGDVIRQVLRNGDLKVIDKGINDLQTEADRQAQRTIIQSLRFGFPSEQLNIVGEEDIAEVAVAPEHDDQVRDSTTALLQQLSASASNIHADITAKDTVIWVDPLDGTAEFTEGLLHHATVLIGISAHGRAIAGVVHQPFWRQRNQEGQQPQETKSVPDFANYIGRTIWGIVGVGSGVYPSISFPVAPPATENIIVTTRSHGTGMIDSCVSACAPSKVLKVGGCGHKILMLLDGQAHAYVFPSPGCKKWDTCGPEAILTACGGKLTDIMGQQLRYVQGEPHGNLRGVLATCSVERHEFCLERIPQDVKNHFSTKA